MLLNLFLRLLSGCVGHRLLNRNLVLVRRGENYREVALGEARRVVSDFCLPNLLRYLEEWEGVVDLGELVAGAIALVANLKDGGLKTGDIDQLVAVRAVCVPLIERVLPVLQGDAVGADL